MTHSTKLISELVTLVGPSGEERAVREDLSKRVSELGYSGEADAKGNLLVSIPGDSALPHVVVTAHMDEIALLISSIDEDGKIRVAPVGGTYAWKWGEGPVEILAGDALLPAVLSFGCIHTNHESSVAEQARHNPLLWKHSYLFTGMDLEGLKAAGVRPGLRVVLARSRRTVLEFGDFIASYFLDDRADLAIWLMALEAMKSGEKFDFPITFAATVSEEVGAEGALYLLRTRPADICIALEIGPKTPDADFEIDANPTIWVRDGYAAMEAVDGAILADCCAELEMEPHWQYLSRGGSDASCASAKGFTARPVTLGLPVENSHGYEIMHRKAPDELLRLLLSYLRALQKSLEKT